MTSIDLVRTLASELARVVGTAIGRPVAAAADAALFDSAWSGRYLVSGDAAALCLGIDEEAARLLSALESDGAGDDDLEHRLSRVVEHVAMSIGRQPGMPTLARDRRQPGTAAEDARRFVLDAEGQAVGRLAIWSEALAARRPAPAVPDRPHAEPPPQNLDLILDLELPLTVRFGEIEMPLHAVAQLGPGSTVELGRAPDDPVDVLVNNRLVARGEVIVVGGNYGVRITQVMTAPRPWAPTAAQGV